MNRLATLLAAAAVGVLLAGSLRAQSNSVRFQFREPRASGYRIETAHGARLSTVTRTEWLKAYPDGSTNHIELGSRVVLHVHADVNVAELLRDRPLQLDRTVAENLFILQAPDAWTALREAERLAALPEVAACVPVMKRRLRLHGDYAAKPNDPYFPQQWHLENRDADGVPLGPDLNIRAAWAATRGEGITIAQADDGIELAHPDLTNQLASALHFNFVNVTASGAPLAGNQSHGTAVAGLIAAEGGNGRGVVGVAPGARLASWVIFGPNNAVASDEQFMNMFQSASNSVAVQNHSWGNADTPLLGPTLIEQVALSNAFTLGRGGRGVVMARAGGNNREAAGNVNDDGYASDPRAIAVAAVRSDGRAASYSNPGACLLVGAPSSDTGFRTLFTTDRLGTLGHNVANYTNDLADYAFDGSGFGGTSGATPQIAGLCALLLAANTNLTVRDVQQILVLSARHFDFADPDLTTNGAGLRVSHNVGFGVPDAGHALMLARLWSNRPPLVKLTFTNASTVAIPDQGLRLQTAGTPPTNLLSAICRPSTGPQPDAPTPFLLLEDVGLALAPLTNNLTGKAALIQRGTNLFLEKINFAAQAGAVLAVIYNRPAGPDITAMAGTDFAAIPAVFLNQTDGEALKNFRLTNGFALVSAGFTSAVYSFTVTNTLLGEHVGVRVRAVHPRRGDLRITLLSPTGTRSVLQRINDDTSAGPGDWTYYTTQHFFEATAGTWTVAVSDEGAGFTGSVSGVDLILHGTSITDTDNDGLDDNWEMAKFGTLAFGPKDDPDGDGYSNMREQIMGTNPNAVDAVFQLNLNLSLWDERLARVSWPAKTNVTYELRGAAGAAGTLMPLTNVAGRFPEAEIFVPYTNGVSQFLRVRTVP